MFSSRAAAGAWALLSLHVVLPPTPPCPSQNADGPAATASEAGDRRWATGSLSCQTQERKSEQDDNGGKAKPRGENGSFNATSPTPEAHVLRHVVSAQTFPEVSE